jgi:gas vesicle protein
MNKNAKILTAAAAGIATGAVLGILFAPASGCDTRKKISKEGRDLTDSLKAKFNNGKEKMSECKKDIACAMKEKVQEFV